MVYNGCRDKPAVRGLGAKSEARSFTKLVLVRIVPSALALVSEDSHADLVGH